jgi:hypothetical protein
MEWNWWVLLVALIAWFVQNCIHEGAHVLAGGVIYGATKPRIYPWPHKFNGRWYYARYSFKLSKWAQAFSNEPDLRSSIHFAPVGAAVIPIVLSIVVFLFLPDAYSILALPFMIAPVIDVAVWEWGYHYGSEGCDGKRYKLMKDWEEGLSD